MKKDAAWIASAVGGQLIGPNVMVTSSVETDSRQCQEGSLYIARVGENSDGHDFISSAVKKGAVLALVQEIRDISVSQILVQDATVALGQLAAAHLSEIREHGSITVIGITGSAGKTTTKDLLGQILSGQGNTVFPILSFNNEVGCPLTILKADVETEFLVLEMGASGPGHIQYLTNIAPLDVATVLMVGSAHLGGFGSIENLVAAKRELVEGISPSGVAVLNIDDPKVFQMKTAAPGDVRFFGQGQNNKYGVKPTMWIENAVNNVDGSSSFDLHTIHEKHHVNLSLVGDHQRINALAAALTAWTVGVPLSTIASTLSQARPLSPHRMAVYPSLYYNDKHIVLVDDSYNANVDSMRAGLRAARKLADSFFIEEATGKSQKDKGGRLVVVLGQMLELGDESDRLHSEVGEEVLQNNVGVVLAVGPGMASLIDVTKTSTESILCKDYEEALDLLPDILKTGDTLLVKGSLGSEVWRVSDALLEESEMTENHLTEKTGAGR